MSAEKLKYIEYYNMQSTFDWLFKKSTEGRTKGIDLYEIITSKQNILLAYRMIKSNQGAKTAGTDELTIDNFKFVNAEKFVGYIRKELSSYTPQAVKRVEIPKPNGKMRPLGIPTMRDRIIQQMFKQVLEPICEAKFYKHSYGFRPNRSTEHAIARCNLLAHRYHCHYVIDIDIKGFFDNVNHTKLLKQLFTIGVTDKRVLAIISKMLKAPVDKLGVQYKGCPQGGILSPLLSNVVLNSLDWWIANQWETFESKYRYSNANNLYRPLKTTRLKEMHIVRYADDFKIYTNSPRNAIKIFHAVRGYIHNELKLEISTEKSRIINLRKRYSEFLGFELRVQKHHEKYKTISRVSRRSLKRLKKEVKNRIKLIQENPAKSNIIKYNSFVRGIQNYYCKATLINKDFAELYYSCLPTMYNRLLPFGKYEKPRSPPLAYRNLYSTTQRTFIIKGLYLFPICQIKWKKLSYFKPEVNNFTPNRRLSLIKAQKLTIQTEIIKMSYSALNSSSIEYSDNKLSKYSMQRGKCAVTKQFLTAEAAHCHHIVPKEYGKNDSFDNLIIVHEWVHKLIHATRKETIGMYLDLVKPNAKALEGINKLRKHCNLTDIH
ncbi:group II intron reverse transcriptase/maturase [Enterococcus hirae]|uniref:group II intron reverse transcriptase/maturase n=1 Tax=Enterococcus TaxID=1350 RepID=UPI001F4E7A4D|nr:group II intron reverse transcriptase/maturase [Enterococcus hirae]